MKAIFDPEEIELKQFVIRWRGYDTREVETFLRAVAVDFRRLIDHAAAADRPAATGDELAEVRAELNRLSSRLDRALVGLEVAEWTDAVASGELVAAIDHGAPSTADVADPAREAELLLLCGGSGGA
jgi:DivIVA domain-containing protein